MLDINARPEVVGDKISQLCAFLHDAWLVDKIIIVELSPHFPVLWQKLPRKLQLVQVCNQYLMWFWQIQSTLCFGATKASLGASICLAVMGSTLILWAPSIFTWVWEGPLLWLSEHNMLGEKVERGFQHDEWYDIEEKNTFFHWCHVYWDHKTSREEFANRQRTFVATLL